MKFSRVFGEIWTHGGGNDDSGVIGGHSVDL
jgi:hypothetical protein